MYDGRCDSKGEGQCSLTVSVVTFAFWTDLWRLSRKVNSCGSVCLNKFDVQDANLVNRSKP